MELVGVEEDPPRLGIENVEVEEGSSCLARSLSCDGEVQIVDVLVDDLDVVEDRYLGCSGGDRVLEGRVNGDDGLVLG